MRPFPQRGGVHHCKPGRHLRGTRAVARQERSRGLAVRQIQPAAPRHQEFAANRGHRVEHVYLQTLRGQPLRRHQARRTATDDSDALGSVHGHGAGAIKAGACTGEGHGMEGKSKLSEGAIRGERRAGKDCRMTPMPLAASAI
ncbi:hypothetical protein D3C72_1531650 [compost metagenome]